MPPTCTWSSIQLIAAFRAACRCPRWKSTPTCSSGMRRSAAPASFRRYSAGAHVVLRLLVRQIPTSSADHGATRACRPSGRSIARPRHETAGGCRRLVSQHRRIPRGRVRRGGRPPWRIAGLPTMGWSVRCSGWRCARTCRGARRCCSSGKSLEDGTTHTARCAAVSRDFAVITRAAAVFRRIEDALQQVRVRDDELLAVHRPDPRALHADVLHGAVEIVDLQRIADDERLVERDRHEASRSPSTV